MKFWNLRKIKTINRGNKHVSVLDGNFRPACVERSGVNTHYGNEKRQISEILKKIVYIVLLESEISAAITFS